MRSSSWILSFVLIFINLEQIRSQDNVAIVDDYLFSQVQKNTLSGKDVDYVLTNMHTSSISKVQHFYFSQTLFGIQIVGTNSSVHVNSENEIISDSNHFIKDLINRRSTNSNPELSALQVVDFVANKLGYEITEALTILSVKGGTSEEQIISTGGVSLTPIPAKLKYLPLDNGDLELVWEISIQELNYENWWSIYVDATTGKILDKINFTVTCGEPHSHVKEDSKIKSSVFLSALSTEGSLKNPQSGCSDCYEVFPYPLESPLYGERALEIETANLNTSPYGWHDTDGIVGPDHTLTTGNNVNAFEGGDNFGYQPDGGATLNFSGYSFNQIFTEENQYEDAAVTNLFYWINILHDLMYVYGFNEEAGNFQEVNYSGMGIGGDSLMALAQNDERVCNGSFATPQEGRRPVMKIDLCDDKDGVFDSSLLIHEYTHGISHRLIGGSNDSGCLTNDEQMGEGWSDWYALLFTMKEDHTGELPRGIATFFRGFGAAGGGVRKYPYSTDLAINPLTYDSIKSEDIPHGVGTVWGSMLWDMTWGLINEYGFDPDLTTFSGDINIDSGNSMAMAIVSKALKITPCSPGIVQSRDAILTASRSMYGDANDCIISSAFARRGLGVFASQGSTDNNQDGIESFIGPESSATFSILNDGVCEESSILSMERGGVPYGGVYSGLGVTDNGDGDSYTFNASIAGIGIHSITYSVLANECRDATFAMDIIEVFSDTEAPFITCPGDFYVSLPYGLSNYTVTAFFPEARDNCTNVIEIRQDPAVGTEVGLGITPITFYATDKSGNGSSCTATLNVEELEFEGENFISIYPNPAHEGINVVSKKDIQTPTIISILDINGRLVSSLKFDEFGYSKFISIDYLGTGIYFIKIESEGLNIVNRLIRY